MHLQTKARVCATQDYLYRTKLQKIKQLQPTVSVQKKDRVFFFKRKNYARRTTQQLINYIAAVTKANSAVKELNTTNTGCPKKSLFFNF